MFNRKLLDIVKPEEKNIYITIGCRVAASIAHLIFAFCVCWAFNYVYIGVRSAAYYALPLTIGFLSVTAGFLLSVLSGHFSALAYSASEAIIRQGVFDKISAIGTADIYYETRKSKDILSDLTGICKYFGRYYPNFCSAIITVAVYLVVMVASLIKAPFGFVSSPVILFVVLAALGLITPIVSFIEAVRMRSDAETDISTIQKLMSLPEKKWMAKPIKKCDISLNNMSFLYDDTPVLVNVNLKIQGRGVTLFTGGKGCGKSTLMSVLAGFLQVDEGMYCLGDCDVFSASKDDFYSHIAYVSGRDTVSDESVRTLFEIANSDISDKEILAALESVNMDEVIMEKGGISYVVDEALSASQKFCLAFAVALASHKDIYLFDEPCEFLDEHACDVIVKNIFNIANSRTVIVASGNEELFKDATDIYHLKEGRIVNEKSSSNN